ncbi:MAG TPA: beta-propeller fold lactonase family protein, partial [Dehalococcoidia bacterium]|nr:beta-propeller fold lactonase family protein [Dehalococcoidia bacterium]
PVGLGPRGIAIHPVTNLLYVANWQDNSMTMIDPAKKTALPLFTGDGQTSGVGPLDVAISGGRGRYLVVSNNRDPGDDDTAFIRDFCPSDDQPCAYEGVRGAPQVVDDLCTLSDAPWGVAVAYSEALKRDMAFVVENRKAALAIIGLPILKRLGCNPQTYVRVPVGKDPRYVVVSPDGNTAFVTNYGEGTVSVVDLPALADAISKNIPYAADIVKAGETPVGIDITPDGRFLYVTNFAPGTVSVIDREKMAVVSTIRVGSNPWGVTISPDGSHVYIANAGSNSISIIDITRRPVVETIEHKSLLVPQEIAVDPSGGRLYVTNLKGNSVTIIEFR